MDLSGGQRLSLPNGCKKAAAKRCREKKTVAGLEMEISRDGDTEMKTNCGANLLECAAVFVGLVVREITGRCYVVGRSWLVTRIRVC